MDELDSPARVVFWPDFDNSEPEGSYPTLREALAAVAEDRSGRTPWIVTLSGKILRPREIEALGAEPSSG